MMSSIDNLFRDLDLLRLMGGENMKVYFELKDGTCGLGVLDNCAFYPVTSIVLNRTTNDTVDQEAGRIHLKLAHLWLPPDDEFGRFEFNIRFALHEPADLRLLQRRREIITVELTLHHIREGAGNRS
jgi:hypothetical protein